MVKEEGKEAQSSLVTELKIRKATSIDSPAIARLSGQLGYPVEPEAMAGRLDRVLERNEHVVFVAENVEVVGWIHAAEQEILEYGTLGEIWGLVVAHDQRGRGVGQRLIEAVEAWARARGLSEIHVRSNVIRRESHPFYERIGFERFKTQHAYRKRLT
jgi:N-acetylglutamate synthase-like GNAT family acetyltransferase